MKKNGRDILLDGKLLQGLEQVARLALETSSKGRAGVDGSSSWARWNPVELLGKFTLGSVLKGCLAAAQAAPKGYRVHCKSAVEDLGCMGAGTEMACFV